MGSIPAFPLCFFCFFWPLRALSYGFRPESGPTGTTGVRRTYTNNGRGRGGRGERQMIIERDVFKKGYNSEITAPHHRAVQPQKAPPQTSPARRATRRAARTPRGRNRGGNCARRRALRRLRPSAPRPRARRRGGGRKCGAKPPAAQSQADAAARPSCTVRSSGAASNDAVSSGSGVSAWRMDRRACAAGNASVGCRDSAVTAHADQAATEAADARR